MAATPGKDAPMPTDLKAVVQQCADPEDVDETITALAKAKAKKLADFSAMNAKDLEDTISLIPPAIKSKLRDALSPFIKQAAPPPGGSGGSSGSGAEFQIKKLDIREVNVDVDAAIRLVAQTHTMTTKIYQSFTLLKKPDNHNYYPIATVSSDSSDLKQSAIWAPFYYYPPVNPLVLE